MKTKLDIMNVIYNLNTTTKASINANFEDVTYDVRQHRDLLDLDNNLSSDILYHTELDEYENRIKLNITT